MITLDESQQKAIEFACDNSFAVICGGAGTGKTTIISMIVEAIGSSSCELCAFAGKAAARLREATGNQASTIHSMLGWKGDGLGFTRKSLDGLTVIIDEASMVSSDLLAEIVRRNPSRLILVGDEAQLPPVGYGQPFHDILSHMPNKAYKLTKCYRNKEAVFKAATEIRNGIVPGCFYQSDNELYKQLTVGSENRAHETILEAVRNGEIDFDQDIVLASRNGDDPTTPCSIMSLNLDIKAIVNPHSDDDNRSPLKRIDPGDRVIRIKNDPTTDTWNGTTGSVIAFDSAGAMWVKVDYPIRGIDGNLTDEVLIDRADVKDWQLGYALTVHKSQGSQYRKVYYTALMRDSATLLDRAMLYTAVTRAKHECYVIGEYRAIVNAVEKQTTKSTVLQVLLTEVSA